MKELVWGLYHKPLLSLNGPILVMEVFLFILLPIWCNSAVDSMNAGKMYNYDISSFS